MDRELLISLIVPALGFVGTLLGVPLGHWLNRRLTQAQAGKVTAEASKVDADKDDVVVRTAREAVTLARQEMEYTYTDLLTVRKELKEEREARQADAAKCSEETASLRLAVNYANQRVERILTYISRRFGVEIDTDDLKTPPPHVVPAADTTPPLPTRSTFQDRPSDQPPDDAA